MYNEPWISVMAQEMVLEVTDWMAGITLTSCPKAQFEPYQQPMDSVLVCAGGKTKISVQFQADPRMFFRLAQKMIGEDPADQEEVQEYAIEYVNVLCGRFISHLFSHWHEKTRYFFPKYEMPPNVTAVDKKEGAQSLFFLSEMQECVVFSWVVEHDGTDYEEE